MKTPAAEPTTTIEPIERSRLLPRVSFRAMMGMTTLAAIVAAIARASGSGGVIATGFMISVAYLTACFVIFTLFFFVVWVAAVIRHGNRDDVTPSSPFAEDQLPPQILPPREGSRWETSR